MPIATPTSDPSRMAGFGCLPIQAKPILRAESGGVLQEFAYHQRTVFDDNLGSGGRESDGGLMLGDRS